ncbi:MAG TPA: hypothetical protein VKS79_25125 [Gemmataceae bacterium]|nr:hypothetical protein [Gemmataceae bacterium]
MRAGSWSLGLTPATGKGANSILGNRAEMPPTSLQIAEEKFGGTNVRLDNQATVPSMVQVGGEPLQMDGMGPGL